MLDRSVRTGLAVTALLAAVLIALRNIVLERPFQDWWWVLLLLLLAGIFGWWMGRSPAEVEAEADKEETPALQPRVRQFLPTEAEVATPVLTEPVVKQEPVVAAEAVVETVASPPAPPAPSEKPKAAEAAPKPARARPAGKDNLKRIEGIGPKMEKALHAAGIETFARLAEATEDELRAAIEAQSMRFAPSMPTWARQAAFLAANDEAGFEAYKEHLVAGREPD